MLRVKNSFYFFSKTNIFWESFSENTWSTCSDWITSKTPHVRAFLKKLNNRIFKDLHIVEHWLLFGLASDKEKPPSLFHDFVNHCEIRNKFFFKAWQKKNKIFTLLHDFFS